MVYKLSDRALDGQIQAQEKKGKDGSAKYLAECKAEKAARKAGGGKVPPKAEAEVEAKAEAPAKAKGKAKAEKAEAAAE